MAPAPNKIPYSLGLGSSENANIIVLNPAKNRGIGLEFFGRVTATPVSIPANNRQII